MTPRLYAVLSNGEAADQAAKCMEDFLSSAPKCRVRGALPADGLIPSSLKTGWRRRVFLNELALLDRRGVAEARHLDGRARRRLSHLAGRHVALGGRCCRLSGRGNWGRGLVRDFAHLANNLESILTRSVMEKRSVTLAESIPPIGRGVSKW